MHDPVVTVRSLILAAVLSVAPTWASAQAAAEPMPCPNGYPSDARCWAGVDAAGSHYNFAQPAQWNGVLVVHAHGGPVLGQPTAARGVEDLVRWSIIVRSGFAYAASVFRQGGVTVSPAAEDTERVRALFVAQIGAPSRTLLHGQSWGAQVATKAAEMFPRSWDGVLLTNGVLGGGTQSYDFRLDLRVVYQAVCNNHPKPDEPAYPLWQGLPLESKLTRPELAARVNECTGVALKPEARSAAQQKALDTVTQVIQIPASSLVAHLNFATWHFQDVAFKRAAGKPVFGNIGAVYKGSDDDAGLNQRVARYATDAAALAAFAADTDNSGNIRVPVLSSHAIKDPTAFVELENVLRDAMQRAGNGERLVNVFTNESEHSYGSDAHYPTLFAALLGWLDRGAKPTPRSIADLCKSFETSFKSTCAFAPDYVLPTLASRVTPRKR